MVMTWRVQVGGYRRLLVFREPKEAPLSAWQEGTKTRDTTSASRKQYSVPLSKTKLAHHPPQVARLRGCPTPNNRAEERILLAVPTTFTGPSAYTS